MRSRSAPMSIRETLGEALGILISDVPAAFYRLVSELEGLSLFIQVDDEEFYVRGASTGIDLETLHTGKPELKVRTCRNTLVELIEGRREISQAIAGQDLSLWGATPLLLRVARASTAFSEGSVRSQRMQALFENFRAGQSDSTQSRRDIM